MAGLSFKEILSSDIENTFMNDKEFSNIHLVNGKPMDVIFDELEQTERDKKGNNNQEHGVHKKNLLIYVKKSEYGPLPAPGNILTLDKSKYIITKAINEDGMYSISLEANKS